MHPETAQPESAQPIELRIQYKRLNSFFADYAKNIHRGYTFISTDGLLDVGTDFVFKLDIPGMAEGLQLRGKVQWVVTPEQSREGVGMGIAFEFGSEHERARIDAIVETLMVASLGRSIYERVVHGTAADELSARSTRATSTRPR